MASKFAVPPKFRNHQTDRFYALQQITVWIRSNLGKAASSIGFGSLFTSCDGFKKTNHQFPPTTDSLGVLSLLLAHTTNVRRIQLI